MLNAQHAKALADEGWTKKEISAFLAEYARVPAYQHPNFWGQWGPERVRPPLNADDSVPILRGADSVKILVAENPGAELFYLMGGDSLHDLPTWVRPTEFLAHVTGIGIMRRPQDFVDLPTLERASPVR